MKHTYIEGVFVFFGCLYSFPFTDEQHWFLLGINWQGKMGISFLYFLSLMFFFLIAFGMAFYVYISWGHMKEDIPRRYLFYIGQERIRSNDLCNTRWKEYNELHVLHLMVSLPN